MDVDRLLNFERRTGVKEADIDEFTTKADAVQKAIQAMMNGEIAPEDVKVEGIDCESEEEKQQKEKERLERKRIADEKAEKLRVQRKQEEIKKWWEGANLMKPRIEANNDPAIENNDAAEEQEALQRARYNFDYSRWNTWVPNDEATLLEAEEEEKRQEEIKNKEFEANNKDFCGNFLDDMRKREESRKQKEEEAEKNRLKGNKFFKAKQFDRACELYMEALKESPFDVKTLTNIAQVHIKQKSYPDALEFLSRTLHLDADHIKALSRKAFILSETGQSAESQATIQHALSVEPNNPDLLSLAKEINFIVKELEDDARAASASKDASEIVEKFATFYQSSLKSPTTENITADNCTNVILTATIMSKDLSASIESSINSKENNGEDKTVAIRVLIRKNMLASVVEYTKYLIAQEKTAATSASVQDLLKDGISACLDLIGLSIEGQRSSKIVILEANLISTVKPLLKAISNMDLIHSVVKFLRCCCKDDACLKTRAAIFSDKQVMLDLGSIMGNLSYTQLFEPMQAAAKVARKESKEGFDRAPLSAKKRAQVVSILYFSAQIVRDTALIEQPGLTKAALTEDGSGLVCALASVLFVLHYITQPEHVLLSMADLNKSGDGNKQPVFEEYGEEKSCLVEALLGMSQQESLRDAFALPLPFERSEAASEALSAIMGRSSAPSAPSSTVVTPVNTIVLQLQSLEQFSLLSKQKLDEASRVCYSNCLATLMNACLAPRNASPETPSVPQAIVDAGGLDVCVSDMSLSDADRLATDSNILLRKAGLLSRIVSIQAVVKKLMEPNHYRTLCRRLALSRTSNLQKWQIDEHSYFVRILASLTSPSEKCRKIAMEESLVQSLLEVFPTPRKALGEVTPETVTLMPDSPAPTLLLGNAARCIMAYADDPAVVTILYQKDELLGVQKLICAMASCGDIRVRRNIAILLAKGCRVPGVREKISKLRGLQMMIELQDKL